MSQRVLSPEQQAEARRLAEIIVERAKDEVLKIDSDKTR